MAIMTPENLAILTMRDYMRTVTKLTYRSDIMLAWLRRGGRVTKRSGSDHRRLIEVDLPRAEPYVRGELVAFQHHELEREQTFGNRHIKATTSLDFVDVAENQGQLALVDLFKERGPQTVRGAMQNIKKSLYIDGGASGNEEYLEGLETFLAQGDYAVTTADEVGIPNETSYAGHTTLPGNSSSDWTTAMSTKPNAEFGYDWPHGNGSYLFDFYSPKMYHKLFRPDGTTAGWINNGPKILRRALSGLKRTGGMDSMPNIFVLGNTLLNQLKDNFESRTRELVPHEASRQMGFPGALQFEGAVLDEDFYCPDGVGYGMNPNCTELFSLRQPPGGFNAYEGGLFWGIGPERVPGATFYQFMCFFFGNLVWHPKYVCKIDDFTHA